MVEKFSIVKQLNTEELNKKLSEFIYKNWYNPYIFVNHETLESLMKPYEDDLSCNKWDGYYIGHTGLIGKYQGYKMFEDNTLDFGEIELR